MATITNVSTGKAKIAGAVSVAATTATLPTDATSALASGWTNLGYISEDGLTNTNSPEVDETKAWGGDVVNTLQTAKPDKFKFKLIEALNIDVLKLIYGDTNVTMTGSTSQTIRVKATAEEVAEKAYCIDMVLRGNKVKRIVIPNGKIGSLGDIVYKDSEVIGYEIEVSALPDSEGKTHIEYIA